MIEVVTNLTIFVSSHDERVNLISMLSQVWRWTTLLHTPTTVPSSLPYPIFGAISICVLWLSSPPLPSLPSAIVQFTQEMLAYADACMERATPVSPTLLSSFLSSEMAKFLLRLDLREATSLADTTNTHPTLRAREQRFLHTWKLAISTHSEHMKGPSPASSVLIWWRSLEVLTNDTIFSVLMPSVSSSAGAKVAFDESDTVVDCVRVITRSAVCALSSLSDSLSLLGMVYVQ